MDHVHPKGDPAYLARICDYENLVYACNRCNSVKKGSAFVGPCSATLAEHVRVNDDGTIAWLTPAGRKLVRSLGLHKNKTKIIQQRALRIPRLYQNHPDDPEIGALYLDYFGYPDDLPNLDDLRPEGNSRPEGMKDSYWRQRTDKRLAEVYL